MTKYCPEMTEAIVKLIAEGKSVVNTCKSVGIDTQSFYNWIKDPSKPEFKESIELAKKVYKESLPDSLTHSLFERAQGFYYDESTVKLATDENGKAYVKEKTTYHRYCAPDVAALIFTLTNLDPKHWKNTQRTEITGKDGEDLQLTEINLDALTIEQKKAILSIGEKALKRLG